MTKAIRFTNHSIISIAERSIEKDTVELVINSPDIISEGYDKSIHKKD